MKIGILTYHRAENYGALLQAYALLTYLRSLGHDVSFVDYWPKYHSDYFSLFPTQQLAKRKLIRKFIFIIQLILWFVPRFVRKNKFQRFMNEKLGLPKSLLYTEDSKVTEKYDAVVYGSDQIWRKQNLGGVEFDDWYFGTEKVQTDRKIVYAGSMGTVATTEADDDYFRNMMKNFGSISVREKDLQEYLGKLGVSSILVNDPVFLLSKEQWKVLVKEMPHRGKYILFYNLLNTRESEVFASKMSKEMGLPILEINKRMLLSHLLSKHYKSTASVEEFLGLIEGAEYVVSNSFHGVAMSIIFQKQFYAVGMRQRSNRVMSLLNNLSIGDRYVGDGQRLLSYEEINYKNVHDTLTNIISESQSFLSKLLENDEDIK